MLNLEELKSAVRIEDQGEIHKALSERKHASPQTAVGRTKSGATKVMKAAGSPAPSAADVSLTELQGLVAARGMSWDPAYEGRAMAYWGSDERVDAHGDIMRQNFVFDEFETNSPMPFSHGWEGLAVGRVIDWKVLARKDKGYEGDALWLLGLFATAEQYAFADSVFRLVKGGIFPAGSVGVWPEFLIRVEDPKERAKLGMPEWGFILDRPHMLEFSPTLLGANPGALAIQGNAKAYLAYGEAKSRGLLKVADFRVIRELQRESVQRQSGDADAWREMEEATRALQRLLFPEVAFVKHDALDEPIALVDEEESMRYVPAPELKSLDERVAQISTMLGEGLTSLMRVVEDVREIVEGLKERPSQGAKQTEEKEPAGSPTADVAHRLRQKLDSINA